jgi:hypothetical protein
LNETFRIYSRVFRTKTTFEFYIRIFFLKYEYEEEMEGAYRNSLLKSFKKNIDGGYFPFLIGIP